MQRRLLEYNKDKVSYIEQFWFDSYLNYDNPVVLNLNPFFLLEDDPTPARANQVTRAASLSISSLCFIRCLRREELAADTIRGKPLCMYQYSRMFGTSRIATDRGCMMQTDANSRHIVVLCRSQFYWFDVLDENNDIILTEQYLSENFRAIIDDASTIPPTQAAKSAIGVLTSESRSIWAEHRAKINEDEDTNNKECLNIIDSALFVVCLDDTEPVGKAAVSENMLCGSYDIATGVQVGTCTNRWYDKLQLIVCKNGSAGINFEHTGVDGHTVLRFVSDIYTDTIMRFAKTINPAAPNLWPTMSPDPSKRDPESFGDVDSTPHRLEWNLNSDLSTAIRFAETRLSDLLLQNELRILEFSGYGSNFMKQSGFSPDAFVQMAFQATYYGLYGRVQSVYEPAMTKSFRHGRTEAIRSTTVESVNFIKRFCEDVSPQIKVDALKKACVRHTAITKEASMGQGSDRHLYALFKMWEQQVVEHKAGQHSKNPTAHEGEAGVQRSSSEESLTDSNHEMPALFADCGWDRLNNTILSTSNCGNPALRMFGFGPTSLDGFGIGYIIKDHSISICASSKHRQTSRYLDTLSNYLLEIRALIKNVDELRGNEKPKTRPEDKQQSRSRSGKPVTVALAVDDAETDAGEGMLGGYGYFDFATLDQDILRQKVNASKDEDVGNAHRRHAIGRRLRLGEY